MFDGYSGVVRVMSVKANSDRFICLAQRSYPISEAPNQEYDYHANS